MAVLTFMAVAVDLLLPLRQDGGWTHDQGGSTVHFHNSTGLCSPALLADPIPCDNNVHHGPVKQGSRLTQACSACVKHSLPRQANGTH